MTSTIVLVGCGEAKADGPRRARDLYTSGYFSLKRQLAELLGDDWRVLSAEHGLVDPDERLEPYETTIGDLSDTRLWADRVRVELVSMLSSWDRVEIVVLAGRDYADPVIDVMPSEWDVRRPFDDVDGGQFEQFSWMRDRIDELTVDEVGEDVDDGKRAAQTLECNRCNGPRWHIVVDAESVEGTAWQCTGCSILRESGQPTLKAVSRGDPGGD